MRSNEPAILSKSRNYPSSANIHLSLTLQQEQPVALSLYKTLGQQVWEEDLGNTNRIETEIPFTNLASGVYVLKVNNGSFTAEKGMIVAR